MEGRKTTQSEGRASTQWKLAGDTSFIIEAVNLDATVSIRIILMKLSSKMSGSDSGKACVQFSKLA